MFRKGYRWADADISEAAGFMKKLYEDRGFAESISKKAKAYIEDKLSMETSVNLVKNRISEIYSEKRK